MAISMPGTGEWIVLALLALLIFGPQRLPEMARGLGRAISRLKAEATSTMDELKRSVDAEGLNEVARDLRGAGDDVRRLAADQVSPVEGLGGRAGQRPGAGVTREPGAGPAPFDPDAT